jgi:Mn-dependent DtxR family transcriptional regulator
MNHLSDYRLTPRKEDYLKTIKMLSDHEGIQSSEIARALCVSKASVSNMMSVLKAEGLVEKEKYGKVRLTGFGRDAAEFVKKNRMSL